MSRLCYVKPCKELFSDQHLFYMIYYLHVLIGNSLQDVPQSEDNLDADLTLERRRGNKINFAFLYILEVWMWVNLIQIMWDAAPSKITN